MRIVSSTLIFNPTKSVSEPDSSLRHGGGHQELQPVQGGHGRGQTVPTVHHKVRPKNLYHKEDSPNSKHFLKSSFLKNCVASVLGANTSVDSE